MSFFGASPAWQDAPPALPGVDASWSLVSSPASAASVRGAGSWVQRSACACDACALLPASFAPWACVWSDPFAAPLRFGSSGFRVVALAHGVAGLAPRSFFSVVSSAVGLPGSFMLLRRRIARAGFPVPAGPWVFKSRHAGAVPVSLRGVQSSVAGSCPFVSFWILRLSGGVWPVPASWFAQPLSSCRRCGGFGGITRPCRLCLRSVSPEGLAAVASPFA